MTGTIGEAIHQAARRLEDAGASTPRLDAQILMAHALGAGRTQAFTRLNEPAAHAIDLFGRLIARRAVREPVAYITGDKEFYSLSFQVDRRVLIPRPETEHVVDAAFELYDETTRTSVLDVGTGSGAVAVTLALHRPLWRVTAVDSSADALDVAANNARRHGVAERIRFIRSDLFGALGDERFDLIVSNPPYVAIGGQPIDPDAALFEPPEALYAGEDGLDVIRRIVCEGAGHLRAGGGMIIEIGCDQRRAAEQLLESGGPYRVERTLPDLAGLDRVIVARKNAENG